MDGRNRAVLGWKARIVAGGLRHQITTAPRRIGATAWESPSVAQALPYTMLRPKSLYSLAGFVVRVVRERTPGDVVECGVWRGGASFLMADVLRRLGDERTVWMFDSYEGMPPVEPVDGPVGATLGSRA